MQASLFAIALLVPLGVAVSQQPVYVDVSATGANNGTSWDDAYTELQTALGASTVGEIWVARGTYYAGPAGDQNATFELRNGLAVYGGFAGTETSTSQRDVGANPTILSGDIDQDDTYGVGTQWWRFNWNRNAGNSYHIVTASGTDASAVLDGFTIFAGLGAGGAFGVGGSGLLALGGSPTVRACTFQYNAFGIGSSVYVSDGAPTFESCIIKDAYTFGEKASGAYFAGLSRPVFRDCDFINHYTVATMGRGGGSAISLDRTSSATFERCDFIENQTGNFFAQGASSGSFGAGIYSLGGGLVVDRCTFVRNFSHAGSGIYTWGPATVTNSLFVDNTAVGYPVTSVVTSGDYGAGFASVARAGTTTIIANCTFLGGDCEKGGGIAANGLGTTLVRNTILYYNTSPPPLPGEDPVWILKSQIVGSYDLEGCCVEGLLQTEPGEDPPEAAKFPACFDTPPVFADRPGGDYHLAAASPCINAGRSSAVPGGILLDLDGNPRFIGAVDLGAYEFAGPAAPSLVSTNFVAGVAASWTVRNAQPGESVFLLLGFTGVGAGPCVPHLGVCISVLPPWFILPPLFADPNGVATLALTVPPGIPLVNMHTQALIVRGAVGELSVVTNSVSVLIQPAP